MDQDYRSKANAYLIQLFGEGAKFRDGQLEAILSIMSGKRILAVQKTGWGKSLIYFLGTRMLRDEGKGPTVVISPLLALMNNQIEAAEGLGLIATTVNSQNRDSWEQIYEQLANNDIDLLLISPERLGNNDFIEKVMKRISDSLGMLVIDEAHCISDWGHDFRPDYQRISDIIEYLPKNIPLAATTATANDRVVEDVIQQLGDDVELLRGPLVRDSLAIDVLHLRSKGERLAWLALNIPKMTGTGIVYCLTVADTQLIASWLAKNGISTHAYYGAVDGELRHQMEADFQNNRIKVLVATSAFGMGIDKPDIGFVLHFQKPGNVIAYYQQIGRAGRNIASANAILMAGEEDDHITSYFIDSAFPSYDEMQGVVGLLEESDGMKQWQIENHLNISNRRMANCLKYLIVKGDIAKDGSAYYKTPKTWAPDMDHIASITALRQSELRTMNKFIHMDGCYMKFIANKLSDWAAEDCGKCSNCVGGHLYTEPLLDKSVMAATSYIRGEFTTFESRRRWPFGVKVDGKNSIAEKMRFKSGIVLSNYDDSGWGSLVREGRYEKDYFEDNLVEAALEVLSGHLEKWDIKWVTSVPSLRRPELVKSFAERVAEKLQLPYKTSVVKLEGSKIQKELKNSRHQYENVQGSFAAGDVLPGNVLLIDDMVDSRWTLTVCSYKLKACGSGDVYTFALANTVGTKGKPGE